MASRQRPKKRYPLPILEFFFFIKMYIIFLLKSMLHWIVRVYRVNENDAASQCKYDQNLTSVGLDHQYLRYKAKIKTPLNVFSPRIPRIKCLCCFKVTDRSSSDVYWCHSENYFQLRRKHWIIGCCYLKTTQK